MHHSTQYNSGVFGFYFGWARFTGTGFACVV